VCVCVCLCVCDDELLHRPDALVLLQLPQALVPLGELLRQQEHLPITGQGSGHVNKRSTTTTKYISGNHECIWQQQPDKETIPGYH